MSLVPRISGEPAKASPQIGHQEDAGARGEGEGVGADDGSLGRPRRRGWRTRRRSGRCRGRSPSGTAVGAAPRLTATTTASTPEPRRSTSQRSSSSSSTWTPRRSGSVRAGRVRRSPAEPAVAASRVRPRGDSRSDQSSAGGRERRGVLRVGDGRDVPLHPRELAEPALRHRPAEVGLGVGGEERERRGRAPLLAHEQHRRERRGQREQRGHGEPVVVERLGQPVAAGAVADLVVVLVARRPAASRAPGRRRAATPWSRPRKEDQVPSWKKPRRSTFASAPSGSKSA